MPTVKDTNKPGESVADLRAVIHSLRMGGFCQVESEALSHIQSLIKELPTAEELSSMKDSQETMQKVREAVGYILSQIDHYSQRNPEYKARFEAKRGFPPRYKVLDWSRVKTNVASCLKRYVTASEEFENIGNVHKASSILKIAEKLDDVLSSLDNTDDESIERFRNNLALYQRQLIIYSEELVNG